MFEKLKTLFSKKPKIDAAWIGTYRSIIINLVLTLLVSYLAASALNAALLPLISSGISITTSLKGGDGGSVSIQNQLNYHDVKKAVLDRNLFNQRGDVPKDENFEQDNKGKGYFDMEAPCEKTALKIKLLGMIAMEGGKGSLAMMKEEGFDGSDIYSEGDLVIGSDNAQIVRIERSKVIINNGGRKECLELKLGDEKLQASSEMNAAPDEIISIDFDSKFVQNELGDGFGKIIQSARMVPNIDNNKVNGFKVFAIQPESLLNKAGFEENDVITKVNNTMMEAEQGFALYQALNDEKQIRVNILRNGTTPKTIVIRVK